MKRADNNELQEILLSLTAAAALTSCGVTETELPQGQADTSEYIGPYPPSGTHVYEIYVLALENAADDIDGTFNGTNTDFADTVKQLYDTVHIIACGHIAGTYTQGD